MDHFKGKIQPPESELITNLMHKTIDPEIYTSWMLLFDEYNKENKPALKMGCRVCYMKVYIWYLKTIKNDIQRISDK